MSIRACHPSLLPPASEPLTSADAALAVTAAATTGAPQVVVLLLDRDRRGVGVLVIDGGPHPGAVDATLELLCHGAAADSMVVASVVPGPFRLPRPDDFEHGRRWHAQAEAAGIDLVDSFVVAGGLAASLASAAGVAPWAG